MEEDRITINDIAAAAGVSVASVSRSLRNLPGVGPQTRRRIVEIADEFGYELHPQASRLASGRTSTVGLAAPLFGTWFPSRALGGIHSVLAEAGYDLLVSMMTTPADRRQFLREARSFCRRVDGVILIDIFASVDGGSADALFNRPVVSVGERLVGAGSIAIDNQLAARRAVEHLIDLGHERIGIITAPQRANMSMSTSGLRFLGYEDALRGAGLRVDPMLVAAGDGSIASGVEAMSRLLEIPEPPTGVFCMSDEMAFGALRAAENAGVPVPDELSVIGFDDHDFAQAMGLTTMRQSVGEMGMTAAKTVLALIEGSEPISEITWDVPLVVRQTTTARG